MKDFVIDSIFDAWNIPLAGGTFLAIFNNFDEVLLLSVATVAASFANHAVKIWAKVKEEKRKQIQFEQELRQDQENHEAGIKKIHDEEI